MLRLSKRLNLAVYPRVNSGYYRIKSDRNKEYNKKANLL